MISGTAATGFRMGVKGCDASPRVWSSSCRLTSEEAMQAELYKFAVVGDGYTLQAFESPQSNRTLYKDSIFGLTMSVENQGAIKLVSVNGGPTFDSKVCRAELDTTGLRRPTEYEVP